MRRFDAPIMLAAALLPWPTLLCLLGVGVVRFIRGVGVCATIYLVAFLAIGIAVG